MPVLANIIGPELLIVLAIVARPVRQQPAAAARPLAGLGQERVRAGLATTRRPRATKRPPH